MSGVGIVGVGAYLPTEVRRNTHWPAEVVAGWRDRMATRATDPDGAAGAPPSAGVRRTLAAMAEYADDPFRGAVERRVMASDMTAEDMEAAAARDAIARAGLRPDDIDAIFLQSRVPEHLNVNSACSTHRLLGLPQRCLAMQTNLACNGFPTHFTLAQAMITTGQARHVLSVHSSAFTRIARMEEPESAWMGDGASAAVIGPVADGRGLLAASHRTDGSSCEAVVFGVPGKRWWEDGRIQLWAPNRAHTRKMFMTLVDRAADTLASTLAAAGKTAVDVDFYASHQGTAWFTRATAEHAGLERAKTLVTFPSFGNMASVNVPFILAMAEREGMLRDDAIVATFSGGAGETWSSLVLRWGR
ncbi:MAG TPA: 3-oxoacyl-[acyl-carrier-protein] synthase III C-terminal domain-containing protein [Polyangiaceae bacterium]